MDYSKLKMIPCAAFGAPMPELRKINYGYSVCVNCSKVGAYKGVIATHGSGDHTWNDIAILTAEQAEELAKVEEQYKNTKFGDAES